MGLRNLSGCHGKNSSSFLSPLFSPLFSSLPSWWWWWCLCPLFVHVSFLLFFSWCLVLKQFLCFNFSSPSSLSLVLLFSLLPWFLFFFAVTAWVLLSLSFSLSDEAAGEGDELFFSALLFFHPSLTSSFFSHSLSFLLSVPLPWICDWMNWFLMHVMWCLNDIVRDWLFLSSLHDFWLHFLLFLSCVCRRQEVKKDRTGSNEEEEVDIRSRYCLNGNSLSQETVVLSLPLILAESSQETNLVLNRQRSKYGVWRSNIWLPLKTLRCLLPDLCFTKTLPVSSSSTFKKDFNGTFLGIPCMTHATLNGTGRIHGWWWIYLWPWLL